MTSPLVQSIFDEVLVIRLGLINPNSSRLSELSLRRSDGFGSVHFAHSDVRTGKGGSFVAFDSRVVYRSMASKHWVSSATRGHSLPAPKSV